MVAEAVQRLRKRLPDANIQIHIPEDFILIPMDATLIEQVLINLMENAYYHGNPHEPIILHVFPEDDQVCFEVLDFGKGIPEDKLPVIFDGSPSTPNASGDSRKGMGIGLTICRTIILAHKGKIYAENHEHGAKLSFCLPLREEKEHDD